MSVFETGFIMWGFFVLYLLFIIAYYGWMAALNRRDRSRQESTVLPEGDRS